MAFWETVLGKYIMTMAIAAVPVVELRGAIPAGIAAGLDPWLACGAAIFGNLLPVPFIILLVRQVFDRLRKHAFFAPKIDALERRAHLKGRLVRKYRLLGLMLFVAIPLPGTGAWTGALIAAFLNIRLRHALPAITLGLLIAGSLVTLMTLGLITCSDTACPVFNCRIAFDLIPPTNRPGIHFGCLACCFSVLKKPFLPAE